MSPNSPLRQSNTPASNTSRNNESPQPNRIAPCLKRFVELIVSCNCVLQSRLYHTTHIDCGLHHTHSGENQRVSTLFQPNFRVFGIDLSGGGCWEHPDIHIRLRKNLIFSGANRVSAAFQLSGGLFFLFGTFWSQNIRVPQSQTFGPMNSFVFQLRFSGVSVAFQLAEKGCSPSAASTGDILSDYWRQSNEALQCAE